MFKHILIPLDGSEMAESAIPPAAFLADLCGAAVTLVHIVEERPPSEVHGEHHLTETGDAEAYLSRVGKSFFKPGTKLNCHVHGISVSDVASGIVGHQAEFDHDLIVMCTHGRSGVNKLIAGSIAQRIISRGNVPVLVVGPQARRGEPFVLSSILLPLDGAAEHEASLRIARELAAAVKGSVHLLVVIPTFSTLSGKMAAPSRFLPGTTDRMLDMAAEEAVSYIGSRVGLVASPGVRVTTAVERGEPAHVIARSVAQVGANLVILGTHGKLGIDAIGEGSVANRVSSQVQVPILLIPLESAPAA